MKISKNKTKFFSVTGIVFILFNVIAFVIPTDKTTTFWVAYGFSVVAFIMQIIVCVISLKTSKPLKSKFLGIPLISVVVSYLVVQLITFAIFMAFPSIPYWISILICTLVLCITLVCLISTSVGTETIKNIDKKVQKKVFYIKSLQSDIEMLSEKETDNKVRKSLEDLAIKFRYSDPISSDELRNIEEKISNKVDELKSTKNKEEIIAELDLLLEERNSKAKLLK